MNRESMLKFLLLLVGLLFSAAIFPLVGGVLHPADSDTGDTMMMSLYFAFETSASFLARRAFFCSWKPREHTSPLRSAPST